MNGRESTRDGLSGDRETSAQKCMEFSGEDRCMVQTSTGEWRNVWKIRILSYWRHLCINNVHLSVCPSHHFEYLWSSQGM